jgi:hypothetical protein
LHDVTANDAVFLQRSQLLDRVFSPGGAAALYHRRERANLPPTGDGAGLRGMFGIAAEEMEHVGDDRLGRALDRLFDADRAALLTEVVVTVGQRFNLNSTSFITTALRLASAETIVPPQVERFAAGPRRRSPTASPRAIAPI